MAAASFSLSAGYQTPNFRMPPGTGQAGLGAGHQTRPMFAVLCPASCCLSVLGTWVAYEPRRHPVSHCPRSSFLSLFLGAARYEMAGIGIIQCHPTLGLD